LLDPAFDVRATPDAPSSQDRLRCRKGVVSGDDAVHALPADSKHLGDLVHADEMMHDESLLTSDNTGHYRCRPTTIVARAVR
jgi:hypothetical protein